ncbi:hypothetical protein ACWDRR_27285 [Kitasatospora sp. NPDC003701]|uniref:hypothetical protein n=1 Tax=Kitasatospora sp. NPDC059973 TaxID=3347020 RepID=UPI0036A645B0
MTASEPDEGAEPNSGYSGAQIEALSAKLTALAAGFDAQAEQLATMSTALEPEDDAPVAEPMFIVAFEDPAYCKRGRTHGPVGRRDLLEDLRTRNHGESAVVRALA